MTPLEKEIKNRAINHIGILSYFSFYLKNLFLQKSITNKKAYVPPACPKLLKLFENTHCFIPVHVMIEFRLVIIEIYDLHHVINLPTQIRIYIPEDI